MYAKTFMGSVNELPPYWSPVICDYISFPTYLTILKGLLNQLVID